MEDRLNNSPFDWYVTEGVRSFARSALLYNAFLAGGPRAAPPGKSAHNYGKAIDVVLDADPNTPGLQASWDIKLAGWVWLFAVLKAHPRLKSGAGFKDGAHIEQYKWTPEAAETLAVL